LTREQKDKIDLTLFATDATIETVISIRGHLLREAVLWRVLVPMLVGPMLACLVLIVLDATGVIPPMRDALLAAVAGIVGGGVISSAIGAGFGWLYQNDN
jgi:hypothetical protein